MTEATKSATKNARKTVAITGAGGALADAVIDTFKRAGWNLALFAYSAASKAKLEQAHPKSFVVQADLSQEDDAREAVERSLEHYGQLDALLNIAGGFAMSSAVETSVQDLDKQLTLNLKTAFNATRAALPPMLERGTGFVVGVGAKPAQGGAANMRPYAASKAALVTYLASVRAEVESKGVGVSLLYPMGTIDTPANRESMPNADPQTWIDPYELAQSMLHLVTRDSRGRIHDLRVYPPS